MAAFTYESVKVCTFFGAFEMATITDIEALRGIEVVASQTTERS